MKVLSIGNSFSQDAHTYLPFLAKGEGEELLLGNLFLAGASLEDHYRNFIDENEVYTYEVFLPNQTDKMAPDGIALHEAVEDDDWDIITLQQASPLSGVKESYEPYLSELMGYLQLVQPKAEIILHQTWAYEQGCDKKEFAEYYDGNQQKMYEKLTECYVEMATKNEIKRIIPTGFAWQIARGTFVGDRLTRDGFHGNEMGQFLGSCCYFEAIFNRNCYGTSFDLPDFDKKVSDILKICADKAFEEE